MKVVCLVMDNMIYIKDDFLNPELIDLLNNDTSEFVEVKKPGKSFWVKIPSEEFLDLVISKIEELENNSIECILGFFREAKEGQDTDWRIHNDSIIEGQQPDRALVLFISDDGYGDLNGTAFWEHYKHGEKFENISTEEYNRLLVEDSNDRDKWLLKSVIGHKKNRALSYPCNYFHSKYPNEFVNSRKVFVMFYKIK
jgi:hypothetical protein